VNGTTLKYRGVIEGFYGPMWAHEERLHLIRHLRGWNMNLYIYAPRDDPYHRFLWDKPYPADEMQRFVELAGAAREEGVQFSYAISPGNTFEPGNSAHRDALVGKLKTFADLGCTLFPILYDDLEAGFEPDSTTGEQQAERQAKLMNGLQESLHRICPSATVLFAPTQYMTADKSRYLCRLHQRLDQRIQTLVTGVDAGTDTVCPRFISDQGAERYFQNFGRRPFFWDNFNVRDNSVNTLHWSPYSGRGANLDTICSGIVLNPQNIYLLNLPVFGCMGDYLADPRRYNPQTSMARHVEHLMGPDAAPLGMTLSRWFTAEWFAAPGDGMLSSEANLPAIAGGKVTGPQRKELFAAIRAVLEPLCDFKARFIRSPMPPRVAATLVAYANLLTEYAQAMVEFCDAPDTDAARLLERVDRPETECFRLPFSLIKYARRLVNAI